MQVRIKKRTSISKQGQQKAMNMTFSTAIFPSSQKQITQLPPIKRNLRKPLPKISQKINPIKQLNPSKQKLQNTQINTLSLKRLQPLRSQKIDSNKQQRSSIVYKQQPNQTIYKQQKERRQTQTTSNQSLIFNQSQYFFQTMNKNWIKPSDYIKDITQLNLIEEKQTSELDPNNYQIKLNEKLQKNVQKIQNLFKLTEKWIGVLRRALFYVNFQKTNSDKLIEQVKFWKALSKKFDQLQYQFNDDKTKKLLTLMKNSLKTNSQHRKMYEQFQKLRDQVIKKSVQIKRLYLTLQQVMAGLLIRFQQSSCIKQSLQLLKRIIFGYNSISSLSNNNQINQSYKDKQKNLLSNRQEIFYNKILVCLIHKILASPIYPKQLANISSIKSRYQLLDSIISFCSNFISILQQQKQSQQLSSLQQQNKFNQIIIKCQYVSTIVSNLIEILCYFEYLYKKKDVKQFSKLFSQQIDYNIYDTDNYQEWSQYMNILHKSMQQRNYQV